MKQGGRRLQLLPEVLPDPTRSADTGSVRQRTLRHMNRLLALAATGASLGACTNGPTGGSPARPPDPGPNSSPIDRPLEIDVELRDRVPRGPGSRGGGYEVVDPIPAPVRRRHPEIARTIHARATWKSGSKTAFRLRLREPDFAGASYSAADSLVAGGTLLSSAVRRNSAQFEIEFETGSDAVDVYVQMNCPGCEQQVRAVVQRTERAELHVKLSDVW